MSGTAAVDVLAVRFCRLSGWCVLMGDSQADRQAVRMSARVGGDVLPSGCGGCPTSALMSGRCVGLYPPIVPARWDDKSGLFTENFF